MRERAQDLRLVVDDEDAGHARRPHRARQPVGAHREADHHRRARRPGCRRRRCGRPSPRRSPRATARPRPTPVVGGVVAEPLERPEHVVALLARDAGTAVDDTELDRRLGRARLDAHAGVRRATRPNAFSAMLAIARSSSAAVGADARAASRARRPRADAPSSPTSATRHHFVEPDVAHHELQRTRLQPAHVEEVADEVVEPVGALVDRLEQLTASPRARSRRRVAGGCSPTALIEDNGVRRSCDTAARSAVRNSFGLLEPGCALGRGPQLTGAPARSRPGRRTPRRISGSACVTAAPSSTSTASPCRPTDSSPSSGRVGTGSPADASTVHAMGPPLSTAAESASNAARTWATSCGSGLSAAAQGAAQRRERLRLGARELRRLDGPARRGGERGSSPTPPTTMKMTSARRFSPSATVNSCVGGVK